MTLTDCCLKTLAYAFVGWAQLFCAIANWLIAHMSDAET